MSYLILTVAMMWFQELMPDPCGLSSVICEKEQPEYIQEFVITSYNTFIEQTDGDPCISDSGKNICGIDNALACPRKYPFGTKFEIDGKIWICYDRTATKYGERLDLSFDKDLSGAINFGKQIKSVKIIDK